MISFCSFSKPTKPKGCRSQPGKLADIELYFTALFSDRIWDGRGVGTSRARIWTNSSVQIHSADGLARGEKLGAATGFSTCQGILVSGGGRQLCLNFRIWQIERRWRDESRGRFTFCVSEHKRSKTAYKIVQKSRKEVRKVSFKRPGDHRGPINSKM